MYSSVPTKSRYTYVYDMYVYFAGLHVDHVCYLHIHRQALNYTSTYAYQEGDTYTRQSLGYSLRRATQLYTHALCFL